MRKGGEEIMGYKPEGLTIGQEALARCIFQIGAFKDKSQSPDGKGFRLKLHEKQPNAPLSPFYLNFRTPDNPKPGPLTDQIVKEIGRQLFAFAESLGLEYTYVCGVPRAGEPLAAAFIMPWSRVRMIHLGKMDEPGGQRQVTEVTDSDYVVGNKVLLVDDLITRADSKKEAIAALERAGLQVNDVLVLLDRQQGGVVELSVIGKKCHALFTIRQFFSFYQRECLITETVFDECMVYLDGQVA